MASGFVKIRRGIVDHVCSGKLCFSEFAVFQLLVLLADSATGSHTINAAVLRSFYFPEMTRDTAQRALVSLEQKGFIFRLSPASCKRAYRYWINKYEATTGPNKMRRIDLSQVFESNDIKNLIWVDLATEIQTETQTEIPTGVQTGIPNSYQEERNKKKEIPVEGPALDEKQRSGSPFPAPDALKAAIDQAVFEGWEYFVQRTGKHPKQYQFKKDRMVMGRRGFESLIAFAKRLNFPEPLKTAREFFQVAVDRLAESPFHNGQNDGHKLYLDWQHLFAGKGFPAPRKLVEFWLDDARWPAERGPKAHPDRYKTADQLRGLE